MKKLGLVLIGRQTPAFLARRDAGGDPVPSDSEVANRLAKAEALITAGSMADARAILSTVARPRGIRLTRRIQLAKLQRKAGDLSASLAQWQLIHAKVPRNEKPAKKVRKLEPREAMARAEAAAAAGDPSTALGILGPLFERRLNHPGAARLLIELQVATGRVREAEAMVGRARAGNPAGRKPLVMLAGAFEAAGDEANTLRVWREAADAGEVDVCAVIARAGRTKRNPATKVSVAAGSSGGNPVPGAPSASGVMDEADGLFRASDEAGLFRFLESHPAWLRSFYETRVLFLHNCLEDALEKSTALLTDPEFGAGLGAGRDARLLELSVIRLRCLAHLGRHDEAYRLLDSLPTDDAAVVKGIELDLCWRSDPQRGLDLASSLWTRPDPTEKTSVLFCTLPLLLNDPELAAKHLRMDLIRREYRVRTVPGDLLLAAVKIQQALGDHESRRRLMDRYFARHSLESPVPAVEDVPGFDSFGSVIGWRSENGPLVSVITTAFNAEKTVSQAVGSIIGQTHANIEILIVDDASTDGTHAVLTDLAALDPRIRLFRNRHNSGTYVSKNFALENARGEYFMFLDSDDWAHPRRIERHLARMMREPGLVATTSDWIRMDEHGSPMLRPWSTRFAHMNPASLFCHASVKSGIGYFDSVRIDADLDHYLRVLAHFGPRRVARIASPLTLGRSHSGSLTRSGQGAQSDEGFSKVRGDYRAASFRWRLEQILTSGSLHLAADPAARDLAADRGIKVRHSPEPVAHS